MIGIFVTAIATVIAVYRPSVLTAAVIRPRTVTETVIVIIRINFGIAVITVFDHFMLFGAVSGIFDIRIVIFRIIPVIAAADFAVVITSMLA